MSRQSVFVQKRLILECAVDILHAILQQYNGQTKLFFTAGKHLEVKACVNSVCMCVSQNLMLSC